ncbi:unnamed protein product [Caenorhabditis angaria]|uniref:PUM-HD domain-containing protein n=1 Tax=Caenorhabditis angaria TaxID=860376 RepID=A0A9P1I8H7_9PELO|nr:unnamed protein product [Caenorhabditis angaria]
MSRPITIINKERGNEQIGSPSDSLSMSLGACKIVENVCGSPVTSFGSRLMAYNTKSEVYSQSPEFQINAFLSQGGRVIGTNVDYAFGTPPPSCHQCKNTEVVNTQWSNIDHFSCPPNNLLYVDQSNIENAHSFFGAAPVAPRNFDFYNTDRQILQPKPTIILPTTVLTPALSPAVSIIQQPITAVTSCENLLQKYRLNPSAMKTLKLSEIQGNLLMFAKDQVGSRFIQQKLENSDMFEKDAIFEEVLENADELVDDIFGNYVVQKFFEYGEQKHWSRLVESIISRVPQYAFQMYACRVLQKALEKVDEPLQVRILEQVKDIVLECMKDQNGNHVIQKAVEKVSPEHVQFIIDVLLKHPNTVFEMTVDPYGCRVVQRCLEYCVKDQTRPIIEKLHDRFEEIVNNQYGNYVVQHVIQHGSERDKEMIIRKVASNLFEYGVHKFSSNVIEKCLERGSIQQKNLLVKSACHQVDRNQQPKMFDQVTCDQRRELRIAIQPHIPILRQFSYGKHILAKLEKWFQKPVAYIG